MHSLPWRHYLSTLIDLVLPRHCLVCGAGGAYLCLNCAQEIPPVSPHPQAHLDAAWHYEHESVKKAIWLLKYRGGYAIAQDLGVILYQRWRESCKGGSKGNKQDKWLVCGTPLSRERQRQRRYNQSALLAKALAGCDLNTLEWHDDILEKTRHTSAQALQENRAARLQNLKGAFAVPHPTRVQNQRILLIDDVVTTGATLNECRSVLLAAGASEVLGLALASG